MGKILITIGLILIIAGILMQSEGKIPLGRLPGDIRIERENFSFYFPITTCIVISLLIYVVIFLYNKFKN
jgi:hypothetical protein